MRRDCTPESLLKNPGQIIWWKRSELADGETLHGGPQDKAKRYQKSLPFPILDVEANAWRCFYTLQEDDIWVGRFEGVKSKPMGAPMESFNLQPKSKNQAWTHFQFRSMTGMEIYFDPRTLKLVNGERETLLFFSNIPGDGEFHNIAAHSQEGSIYRPGKGSKIVFEWGLRKRGKTGKPLPHQEIEFPEFCAETKNWYCYFTLGADEKWTAVFEGVKKE